jgi:uncharacterized protein YutE (UPF0331/DUF86 family)
VTAAFDEDVVLAKVSKARTCIDTVRGLHGVDAPQIEDWMRLDLTVLNLQRAIDACLDLANHLIASNGWELPRSGRHSIAVLVQNKVVPSVDLDALASMVGFRNIAVHNYAAIDPAVVGAIVSDHLDDILRFTEHVMDATVRSNLPKPS